MLSKSKARAAYLDSVKETSDFCYLLLHPEITRVEEAVETAKTQGDVTAALVLQEVIQLYPQADNITSAKDMLALLQEQQRKQQEAEDSRKKAEQEAKDRLLAQQRHQLKAARESNDLQTAIDSVQLLIKNYPTSPCILDAKSLLRELQAKQELINSSGL
jgi:outer membrane protein assembly factor BamD (BamD/ComL family)